MRIIDLDDLIIDPALQSRAGLYEDTIKDLVETLTAGISLDPIDVYSTPSGMLLASGYHRVEASRRCNRSTIAANLRQGSREDAVFHSCGQNAQRGRTPDDNRAAVRCLLEHLEATGADRREWSERKVAAKCRLTKTTTHNILSEIAGQADHLSEWLNSTTQRTSIGRGGTERTQDTAKQAAPKDAAPAIEPAKDVLEESRAVAQASLPATPSKPSGHPPTLSADAADLTDLARDAGAIARALEERLTNLYKKARLSPLKDVPGGLLKQLYGDLDAISGPLESVIAILDEARAPSATK